MTHLDNQEIMSAADYAVRQIPPAWPLSHTVAVNPFLGQAGEPLTQASARLSRLTGARFFPDRSWFAGRIKQGLIQEYDLRAALERSRTPLTLKDLHAALAAPARPADRIPMVSDLAGEASGKDWNGILADRIGAWAAAWFDEGQALWVLPEKSPAWTDWRGYACHDLVPEILGASGFAAAADRLPHDSASFIAAACKEMDLPTGALKNYFHALLLSLGGWSQLARYKLWQSELHGKTPDETATDLLAIRLFWEQQLFLQYKDTIATGWRTSMETFAAPVRADSDTQADAVLLLAAEIASARQIDDILASTPARPAASRPALQAAFCIDVRSEIFRRKLEQVSPDIETIGFAGFFGLTAAHRRFASDTVEHRLPVLLPAGLTSVSGGKDCKSSDNAARYQARASRAWGRFRQAAVSSFAFVEAAGITFASKLVSASLGHKPASRTDPQPRFDPVPDTEFQINAAETILRAMSLTKGFAPLVLLVGHGATVVNNPHHSALQCGACGGYSGEVNARLLAAMLNQPEVRTGLGKKGIIIPGDTIFVAGLHDTTTDEVTLYADHPPASASSGLLGQAREWLAEAGRRTRSTRAGKLPGARSGARVARRSRDWSETRPEWGLAGCKAFIAAPREMTAGRKLSGTAFLHNYTWRQDEGFRVLELILTAPVVVASWISLQYYGSSVAPDIFGGGNKVLHNVVGGFGVLEGNGGLLRTGLPLQSVHDGERLIHDPVRLTVCVAAPASAINDILGRHAGVRALFDNGWLQLCRMNDEGRLVERYCGNLVWEPAPWQERPARAAAA